jgi:Helix-turn-helix domain
VTQRLLTAEQACARFGIPKLRTLRTMRGQGLAAVRLGGAYLYSESDIAAFIESKKCRAPTEAPACIGSPNAGPSTYSGTNAGQSDYVLQARQIAARLKAPLQGSSGKVIALPARASQTR